MIVVNFNQPAGEYGQKYQPAVVEVRCEALTDEGAVRNVSSKVNIGSVIDAPLTLKQIYAQVNKTTVGGILAGALKAALLDAIQEDASV